MFVSRTIVRDLKRLVGKIIGFFSRAFSKDVVIFLCFVLVSLFFWTLQAIQEIRTYELTIPVVYEPVPKNVTITNKLPLSFKVTLRDKGLVLFQYFQHRKDKPIHLNPMDWYQKDAIGHVDGSVLVSRIRSVLQPTTELLSVSPDTLAFYFVEKASRQLRVLVRHHINPYAQHQLSGSIVAHPAFVIAYAPKEVLDKMDHVETDMLRVEGLKGVKTYRVKLRPQEGVRYSTEYVMISVKAEEFTEKIVNIPVVGVGFPANERLLAFPSIVKVSFLVGLSDYERINESDFQIGVTYNQVVRTNNKEVKLQVLRQPVDIQGVKVRPEQIECLIEKK